MWSVFQSIVILTVNKCGSIKCSREAWTIATAAQSQPQFINHIKIDGTKLFKVGISFECIGSNTYSHVENLVIAWIKLGFVRESASL